MTTATDYGRTTVYPATQPVERYQAAHPVERRAGVDQLQFGIGAVLTAAVTALTGALAIIVARDIIHIPVGLEGSGVAPLTYGLCAGFLALVVAGLYNALIHVAPHPTVYFGWLVAVGALLAAVLPFAGGTVLVSAAALATANLLVGLVIACLVPLAAVRRDH